MLTPAAADAAIAGSLKLLPADRRRLADAAGCTLREPVLAERDQPPFDRVAMDGIAIRHGAWLAGRREFRIAGVQAAGAPPQALPDETQCLEAMTGAVLPEGADAIVPVEQIEIADGVATVDADLTVEPWHHVHRRGSDLPAGARMLAEGALLRAPEIAIVASAGRAAIEVTRPPSIAVISTGDELVEPGGAVAAWQIRRSNVHGVVAALRLRGYASVTDDHVPDDLPIIRARLAQHLERHDVIVLSGGVSAGRYDHVPRALADAGVTRVFHKVAQRPGKPFWFGTTATGRAVFALPGNPVSTLVCLVRYVLPALAQLSGATQAPPAGVALAADVAGSADLTLFLPVDLVIGADGARVAKPHPTNGSGDFSSLAGTAGFIELAAGRAHPRGSLAPFHPW